MLGLTVVAGMMAAVYLMLRRRNLFMHEIGPESVKTIELPSGRKMRLGHALQSSRVQRRWTAVLLALLQDRRRPLWPWLLEQVPVVAFGVMGILRRDWIYGYELAHWWQLGVCAVFVTYYIYALRQYGRWLRDNFADLEHKEVWQSLTFALVLFAIYTLYTSNMGEMPREYLSQVLTVVLVAFLVWRAETLQ